MRPSTTTRWLEDVKIYAVTLKGDGIPLPSIEWVRQRTHALRAEMEIARHLGLIEAQGDPGDSAVEHEPSSDRTFAIPVQEKYFLLLLVHLYERWFLIEKPNRALENLVLYFKDRKAIGVGDGMLPARIAGIGASDESTTSVDAAQYLRKMEMHEWLGTYVRAAVTHEAFSRPAL